MSSTRAFCSVITGLLALGLMVEAQETQGTPGVDYPNYDKIPETSFRCSEQKYIPGLYADMETRCQVFHFCDENVQESFLCPPGTTFNQVSLACDSWDNSNCSLASQFYSMNSGPEIENAVRNILMVLQIRNKSRSRPSIRPSADVYDKITSLYYSTIGEEQSVSPDLAVVDLNAKSNDKTSYEVGSQEVHEEASERSEESESRLTQDLSAGMDESILNDEFTDISEVQDSESREPEIFYDPVTEKYYVDYDSSQAVNEVPEYTVDQSNSFYNYGDFVKRYGLIYNEYVDEIQSDSKERVNDLEFNEILATAEGSEKELLRRMLDAERLPRRVRRRPLYAVVQDDDEVSISGVERGVEYPMVDSDNKFKTESTDSEASFEFPDQISEGNKMQEKPESETYEVVESFQNPNIASVDNSEVPQTSEEFERAILSELVLPQISEHGFGRSLLFGAEQSEESLQNDSQDYQTVDRYSYVENVLPDDYSTDYTEVDTEVVGEPESKQETRDNEESSNWYRDEESVDSENTVESDGTYVVIPDEYDSALEQYSEINEVAETYDAQSDATNSYGAWIDFLPSYVSPAAYTPVGPYWLSVPPYYPDEYGRQAPLTSEDLFNPELLKSSEYVESGILNDQAYLSFADLEPIKPKYKQTNKDKDAPSEDEVYQHGFAHIYPDRYFPLADSRLSFPGHVYDYGTEYGYPYANVYGDPNTGHFGYDTSEVKVATESSYLNENPDSTITGNRDYSESEMRSWAQSYSTGSSEIEEEEMKATESPVQTEEAFADIYFTSRTDGDSNLMPSELLDAPSDEDMKQVETFYLFDFGEDSEEFQPDNIDGVSGSDQLSSNELFQAEEPSRRNESLDGDLEGESVGSESESTATGLEEFDKENRKLLDSSETAEDPRHNGDLVSLSASGNLTALNTPKTQSPRQPRSYDSNINLSKDPSFLNKIYPEPNFRLQDAVMAQTYNSEDEFFHRTGNAGQSRVPKLAEIQKRILSLKQGKFGTLKKYINSAGKKN